jgi:HK97 gp10 family phage protein
MAIEVEYKNNTGKFLLALGLISKKSLDQIGEEGVQIIQDEAPVLTGEMRKKTKYRVTGRTVYFLNDADYAKYVELGTMFQYPNPFMRRGLFKGRDTFTRILLNNLGVGR